MIRYLAANTQNPPPLPEPAPKTAAPKRRSRPRPATEATQTAAAPGEPRRRADAGGRRSGGSRRGTGDGQRRRRRHQDAAGVGRSRLPARRCSASARPATTPRRAAPTRSVRTCGTSSAGPIAHHEGFSYSPALAGKSGDKLDLRRAEHLSHLAESLGARHQDDLRRPEQAGGSGRTSSPTCAPSPIRRRRCRERARRLRPHWPSGWPMRFGRSSWRTSAAGVAFDIKADASPVTVADREAEATMRRLIEDGLPGARHPRRGVRRGAASTPAYVWVLDPIDGTKSFVTGKPLFGTLIALLRDGRPIVGVIDMPALDERWVGVEGRPTTFNGRPVRVRTCDGARSRLALRHLAAHVRRRRCRRVRTAADALLRRRLRRRPLCLRAAGARPRSTWSARRR